ncbi:MAG: dipeptidase [Bryobacterales bacterium]|nr:dipeptidase [Bryobacterales bacterium]
MNRREFMSTSFRPALALGLAADLSSAANERIERPRQAAIETLKPSRKDLEHGLELHSNSLVVESYGFSPTSAIDGQAMRAAIEAGASAVELEDLQEEMNMTRHVTVAAEQREYKEAWDASGVTCILQNAGAEGQDPPSLMKRLARFTYVTDILRDFIFKAATPSDIVEARKQKKHCLYFSGNSVPLSQRWDSVEDELAFIRLFFQLGIRMMHLTYNRRNMLADGCGEASNGGLSDLGRAAIAEMNRLGVIVDVAHTGWKSSFEAAKVSSRPMVASHSGCVSLHQHIRSKPDEVIRAIADTGGYVGVFSISSFLGRSRDLNAMLDHIDYIVKHFGADHAAIGTDLAFRSSANAAESAQAPRRPKSRPGFEGLWPGDSYSSGAQHPSLAWINWPLFTVGMVQRGHSDQDIQKILGGNVLRVARAVFPGIVVKN